MTNTYRIAVIPGDGSGNEVMPEAIKVLEVLAGSSDFEFIFEEKDGSCERFHKTGAMMPEDGLERLVRGVALGRREALVDWRGLHQAQLGLLVR